MRLQKKSLSKVSLLDLLRRKRTNLTDYLGETGIVTYDLLVKRCNSIGLLPPSEDHFLKAKGYPITHEVSSPTEGIVVLEPAIVVDFDEVNTDINTRDAELNLASLAVNQTTQKIKRRKKKEEEDPDDHQ
jgi:hypothetical protein